MWFDLDGLRRRMIVGGTAVCGLIYLLLLRFEMKEPSPNCLMGLFVGWLFLFILWIAY